MKCCGDGGDESSLVSLVAFDEAVCKSLLALSKGDSVYVSGSGKPSTWNGRDGSPCLGLNVVVKVLMTQYGLTKKRKASADANRESYLPARSPLLDAMDEDGTALF
jgi:single-stranded DNA-binding protein